MVEWYEGAIKVIYSKVTTLKYTLITTYQRDHFGEVVIVRAVDAIFILLDEKHHLLWYGMHGGKQYSVTRFHD